VKGIPYTVAVDDYIPFRLGGGTLFARQSQDGSIWAMLIEKVLAKINGNYEFLNEG
jgi:hypothetical protein